MSYYSFSHRTLKWWRRAFFHLLDNAIVNAYVLYVRSEQSARKLDHKHFRIELAKQLLGDDAPPIQPRSRVNALPPPARLTERHFPRRLPNVPVGGLHNLCVWSAATRGAGVRRRPPINVSNVSYPCVLFLVLKYIILK